MSSYYDDLICSLAFQSEQAIIAFQKAQMSASLGSPTSNVDAYWASSLYHAFGRTLDAVERFFDSFADSPNIRRLYIEYLIGCEPSISLAVSRQYFALTGKNFTFIKHPSHELGDLTKAIDKEAFKDVGDIAAELGAAGHFDEIIQAILYARRK